MRAKGIGAYERERSAVGWDGMEWGEGRGGEERRGEGTLKEELPKNLKIPVRYSREKCARSSVKLETL